MRFGTGGEAATVVDDEVVAALMADMGLRRSEYSDERLRVQPGNRRILPPAVFSPHRIAMLCCRVLSSFLGIIWRHLPQFIRRRAGHLAQTRFAVTVAAMLFDDHGRILLLEHVFRADAGWGVPGGFIKKGENPETALRRELREEIDIEIDDVKILFTRTLGTLKQVEIYFRARVVGEPKPSSFEIKSARWFAVDELPAELSNDQRRLVERAISLDEKCR